MKQLIHKVVGNDHHWSLIAQGHFLRNREILLKPVYQHMILDVLSLCVLEENDRLLLSRYKAVYLLDLLKLIFVKLEPLAFDLNVQRYRLQMVIVLNRKSRQIINGVASLLGRSLTCLWIILRLTIRVCDHLTGVQRTFACYVFGKDTCLSLQRICLHKILALVLPSCLYSIKLIAAKLFYSRSFYIVNKAYRKCKLLAYQQCQRVVPRFSLILEAHQQRLRKPGDPCMPNVDSVAFAFQALPYVAIAT